MRKIATLNNSECKHYTILVGDTDTQVDTMAQFTEELAQQTYELTYSYMAVAFSEICDAFLRDAKEKRDI